MNIQLADVKLTVRTSNCLYRMGLTTLGDLARTSESDLMRQPNFGKKCLTEVRSLLSSPNNILTYNTLDFGSIEDHLLLMLLRPVKSLNLTTRARSVMDVLDIETVGDLIQLTELELLRTPNVGRLTIINYKEALAEIGFSLGITITNWPEKSELSTILESRAIFSADKTLTPVETFKFLEEELCGAVQMTVDHNTYAIVVRRTGWDGGEILTLEELGNGPVASGRTSTVSRERIRQIETRGLARVKEKAWSMPILERAVSLIEENAPLATASIQSVLEQHQLSRCGLGYEAVTAAMKTFQVNWNLVYRSIGQESYLLPTDEADSIESVWTSLIEEANCRDFVTLDEIESANQRAIHFTSDIAVDGINKISQIVWLDHNLRIYWSLERARRGWNKIINVCRKILTVAPKVPFGRLMPAIERARTIKDYPSPDTVIRMLLAMGDIEIQDETISRDIDFKFENLSKADWFMINAARDVGTVTTFLKLREALVRQGVSINHAQQLMVITPLWTTPSRGKYRFIANNAQLKEFFLAAPTKEDEAQKKRECLVELEISHRHLVTGCHRIEENFVRPGQWLLKDEMGNDIEKIDVTENMVKGLSGAFTTAGIGVGTFLIIDFSDQQYTATAYF